MLTSRWLVYGLFADTLAQIVNGIAAAQGKHPAWLVFIFLPALFSMIGGAFITFRQPSLRERERKLLELREEEKALTTALRVGHDQLENVRRSLELGRVAILAQAEALAEAEARAEAVEQWRRT